MTWNISKLWKNDNTSKLRIVSIEKDYVSHTNNAVSYTHLDVYKRQE